VSRDEIDGVAFALGKLTEALLEQIRLTKVAEADARVAWNRTGAMEKRYVALVDRLQAAYDEGEKFDTEDTVLKDRITMLLEDLKKEED